MILQHLNWLAVAVSAIAYFALGAIWFNPKVFGTMWMKGHGITPTEEDKKNMGKTMAMGFVLGFIATIGIAYLSAAIYSANWMTGAKLGIVCGGMVFLGIAMNHMYTKKSMMLSIIDGGYHFVGLTMAAVILSVWR